jgi:hypothetical protein
MLISIGASLMMIGDRIEGRQSVNVLVRVSLTLTMAKSFIALVTGN